METSGSRFIVDLGDVKLPPLIEHRVDAEIKAVVLRALAEVDVGADQRMPIPIRPTIWDKFPGMTMGMIGPDGTLAVFPRLGVGGSLTIKDHTLIVRAVMEHPLRVYRNLPNKYRVKSGSLPSGQEVLEAALKVEKIDDRVKARVRLVLEMLPMIEEGQAAAPLSLKNSVDDLRRQLVDKTIAESCKLLRSADLRSRYRDNGLARGMELAAQILEDGQDSIYSPDFSFYALLEEGQGESGLNARARAVDNISAADTIGGTAGGFVGSVVPVLGTAAGAVAGGTGASAGAAIGSFINWLRE